jgi:hypothetical protein
MQPVTYHRRRSAMSRSEREWSVEPDALVTRSSYGAERRYLWKDFASIRLCHEPARHRPWRYVLELQPKHRRKITIDNAHYAGPRDYKDRSETYTPFVRAVAARIAAANPKARALIGETPKRYFFLLLLALVGLGGLAFTLIAVRTPLDQFAFAPLIKFAVVVLMLPFFWRWVIKAMPHGVPMDAIPDRALPPEAGAGDRT